MSVRPCSVNLPSAKGLGTMFDSAYRVIKFRWKPSENPMRVVDGFTLEPKAVYLALQQPGWYPALRVHKPGTNFDEEAHQSLELSSTESEALGRAIEWMNLIRTVSYHGELHIAV